MIKRIIFTLLFMGFAFSVPAETEPVVSFVVAADPQFGMIDTDGEEDFREERAHLELALRAVNSMEPHFILFAGDMINRPMDHSEYDAFKETMAILKEEIPSYYAAGNHDHHPDRESLEWYHQHFGEDIYSFSIEDCFFLVLNSNLIKYPDHLPEKNERQLEVAEEYLQEAEDKGYRYKMVFQHHPFYVSDPEEGHNWRNVPRQQREKYLSLFHEYDVDMVFTGHLHSWAKNIWKEIELIAVPAVSNPLGQEPQGFLLVEAYPDSIQYEYLELSEALRHWDAPLKEEDLEPAAMEYLEKRMLEISLSSIAERDDEYETLSLQTMFSNPFSQKVSLILNSRDLSCIRDFQVQLPPKQEAAIQKTLCSEYAFSPGGHEFDIQGKYTIDSGSAHYHSMEVYIPPGWVYFQVEEEIQEDGLQAREEVAVYKFDRPEYLQLKDRDTWEPDDLSLVKKAAYCEDYLHMLFIVEDDVHYNSYEGEGIWQGDSVQMGLFFSSPEDTLYFNDVLEFAIALTDEGPQFHLYSPSHVEPEDAHERIDYHIEREDDTTLYTLHIPRDILGKEYRDKDSFHFSFVVNDNDGEGFDGGMTGARGIYDIKNPEHFARVKLD